MEFNFGFNIGDILYFADRKHGKVCKFHTDCIKVFYNNVTVHGQVLGLYGPWCTPMEVSIKNLNKRVIFTKEKNAKDWL